MCSWMLVQTCDDNKTWTLKTQWGCNAMIIKQLMLIVEHEDALQ